MTIRQLALALPLLVMGWLGTLLVVSVLTDEAPAYVVVLPSPDFLAELDPRYSILSISPLSVTLATDTPDVAAGLYRSGARMVLPAGLPGCLPLSATATQRLNHS